MAHQLDIIGQLERDNHLDAAAREREVLRALETAVDLMRQQLEMECRTAMSEAPSPIVTGLQPDRDTQEHGRFTNSYERAKMMNAAKNEVSLGTVRAEAFHHGAATSSRRAIVLESLLSAGCVLAILAAHPAAAQTIPGRPANKSACLNITSYGAQPNGADATQAIQNAINAAKSRTEKCVYIPTGTFNKGRLNLDSVKLIGDGPNSVLKGANPRNHQLRVVGSGAGLYDLKTLTVDTSQTDNAAVLIDFGTNNWWSTT